MIYLTKVWGFDSPVGPLQFGTRGWRDNARQLLRPGDTVLLVGTMDEPTAADERGCILGVMEPTTEIVDSLSFQLPMAEADFDGQGAYRWPFGLLNVRAWRVAGKPLLTVLSLRTFNMNAALGIVPLTDEEAFRAEQLILTPVPLLEPSPHAQRRVTRLTGIRYVAPVPTTTRAGIMHMRTANASTYLMELVGAAEPSFKVGWAFDPVIPRSDDRDSEGGCPRRLGLIQHGKRTGVCHADRASHRLRRCHGTVGHP